MSLDKEILKLIGDIKLTLEKCPWAKEQTLENLKNEPLNEAIELKEAIEKKDIENIKEELGDLIYDTLLLVAIAEKNGILKPKEVLEKIIEKIRRRKPWVFGNEKVKDSKEASKRWFEIKKKEKEIKL